MKTITSFLSKAVLAIAGVVAFSSSAYAQVSWKGSDVTKLTTSDKFYLYNVGTGKFVIAGGQWGTQAMMRYATVGTRMHMDATGGNQIVTNLQASTTSSDAKYLGVNYVDYTTVGAWNDACSKTIGVFMEAQTAVHNVSSRYLSFSKVESSDANDYTYTITENLVPKSGSSSSSTKKMLLGAAWGFDTSTGTDAQVLLRNFVAFTEKGLSDIPSDYTKFYQWKLVTLDELKSVYLSQSADEYGGFNANASYLLYDPFFERGNTDFEYWKTTSTATGSEYRYDWFNSTVEQDSTVKGIPYERWWSPQIKSATTTETPWDKFIFKKLSFNTKKYGAYTYAILEGKGSVTQSFTIPSGSGAEGVFEIQAVGFYSGAAANAPTIEVTTSGGESASMKLVNAEFTKYNGADTLSAIYLAGVVGKAIYDNKSEKYTVSTSVYVHDGETVTITMSKPAATKSSAVKSSNRSYYYDTDFTALDHVAIHFLGKKVFAFEEDRTSTDYMSKLDATAGANVTTFLNRTFSVGEWNSLCLPIDVTSAIVKDAFGEDAKVAVLDGVGTQAAGYNSLDFKTVDLDKTTTAIEKGKVYLIKPTKEAVDRTYYVYDNEGVQSETEKKTAPVYNLGRRNLNGENLPDIVETTTTDGKVKSTGTYIKKENGCPQGAYVYRKGDVYHLTSNMTIKGFRGWFDEVTPSENGIKSIKFDGGEITSVDKIIKDKKATGNIYTVDGVVVRIGATSLENLPAGTYIFNGKKYLVK